jgi:hypothetical protein
MWLLRNAASAASTVLKTNARKLKQRAALYYRASASTIWEFIPAEFSRITEEEHYFFLETDRDEYLKKPVIPGK